MERKNGLPPEFNGLVTDEEAIERFFRMDKRARRAIIEGARGLGEAELEQYLMQRLKP